MDYKNFSTDYEAETTYLNDMFSSVVDEYERTALADYLDRLEEVVDCIYGAGWETDLEKTLSLLNELQGKAELAFVTL